MKTQNKSPQKTWQPHNRKSQILVTIAIFMLAGYQIYAWHNRTNHKPAPQNPSSQTHK